MLQATANTKYQQLTSVISKLSSLSMTTTESIATLTLSTLDIITTSLTTATSMILVLTDVELK